MIELYWTFEQKSFNGCTYYTQIFFFSSTGNVFSFIIFFMVFFSVAYFILRIEYDTYKKIIGSSSG